MLGPNFFIIGAAKAATTSLSSLLESHPQAAIVQTKEPHFFSYDECYDSGWNLYLTLFTHCLAERVIGDASTSYSRLRQHPKVVDRIGRDVPHAKFIYMVRHPLERVESAYVEIVSTALGKPYTSVNDAVRQQPMLVDSSRYWEVFNAYRERFGESRIKVIWFEEYVRNTLSVFREVCRFLEIDETWTPDIEHQRINSRNNAPARMASIGRSHLPINTTWEPEIQRSVINQIREDNVRFLEHFGRPKDHWGDLF